MAATSDHSALRHVVLFRMYDACTDAEVEEMLSLLRPLGDLPGILSWTVDLSLDGRKGRVIVEDALFESEEALDSFRRHPRHAVVAEKMSTRADWLIGNYWTGVSRPSSDDPPACLRREQTR